MKRLMITRAAMAVWLGMMSWAVPLGAQHAAAPDPTVAVTDNVGRTDTAAAAWDLDNDGQFDDSVSFGTFFQSGQVFTDGITLPASLTGKPNPVRLGNGHGMWRYRQQDRTLQLRTFHASVPINVAIDEGLWRLHAMLSQVSAGRFAGEVTIEQYSSLSDFRMGKPPVWSGIVKYEWDFDYNAGAN